MSKKVKCVSCEERGRRFCPAFDNMICSVCCGSKRGSDIQCASDCQHYPFSTTGYDLWLKTDAIIAKKTLSNVVEHYGKDKFEEVMRRMSFEDGVSQPEFMGSAGAATDYLLYLEEDDHGETLVEKWQRRGLDGLNNDERVMIQYRKNTTVTIIEIQKVLDHQAIECIDLFDAQKKPFLLFDRNMASCAKRFTRILTWLTHYPHFSRPNYGGVEIPDTVFSEVVDLMSDNHKKEKKKRPDLTLKKHLAENFGVYCGFCCEMARAKREDMLNNIDIHHCTATYAIDDKAKIEAILEEYPDFKWDDRDPDEGDAPDTLYYIWLRQGESKELEKEMHSSFRYENEDEGVGIIGNIKLHSDKLIIEAFAKQKFAFAKKMVEKYFKGLVVFQREKIVDLAKQMAECSDDDIEDEPHSEQSQTLPPDVERSMMEDFYKKNYEKFLNDSIPMIDGKTPREAAAMPELRSQLIELMKLHLRNLDRLNKDKNMNVNIDWVLDELGLSELK